MRFPPDRGRLVAVLTSVGCVAAVVLGATVATSTLAPAVTYAQTGHWVVNAAESAVVHVDGGTSQVDARVELPADLGDPLFALQGEQQGFVVAADRIAVFGRSSLTVDSTIPVEFAETPVGIETVGGPYLVYREAGTIVRLGVPPLSLPVGGRLDRPVWTDDGTVWLHRPDNGSFCALRRGADVLDCSVSAAPGEPGGLSVTGELPAFVGTRQDAAQVIASALGSPVGLGTDVPDAALLADRDTEGRLAVVEPATNRLVLTDSSGVPDGRDGAAPVVVELGPGTFTSPVASGGVIALLDTAANRLLTFDVTGLLVATTQLPPGAGAASVIRGGDGRIYVDDADGSATHIVGADGSVTTVGTGGAPSELVAVAAPPSRRAGVTPPPPGPGRSPQNAVVGFPSSGPGPQPPGPRPPGPQPSDPQPVSPPAAPVGVTARIDTARTVAVSWQPVDGAGLPVSYVVTASDGTTKDAATASVEFGGLPVGRPLTFTVRATVDGLASLDSASSNSVVLFAPAGPVGGFRAAEVDYCSYSCTTYDLSWATPELNGGELLRYDVFAYSSNGDNRLLSAVPVPTAAYPGLEIQNCELPADVLIEVITRNPITGEEVRNAGSSFAIGSALDCTIDGRIEGRPTGPESAQVLIHISGGQAFTAGDCYLTFNGETRWTGICGSEAVGKPIVAIVDGLVPETAYLVQLTIDTPGAGANSTSNVITVRTAAAPQVPANDLEPPPVQEPEPEPPPADEPEPEQTDPTETGE